MINKKDGADIYYSQAWYPPVFCCCPDHAVVERQTNETDCRDDGEGANESHQEANNACHSHKYLNQRGEDQPSRDLLTNK